ncbi:MAG: 50S ribosomal protein L32 [Candidatus Microthrix sp.]|nr:50S ribosomal protein L32 [Candidatus Microthrix sp.]MBK6439509.1 50S ribosomal protein L32 [Candidatus Microthrix sp.]
MAVPKRKTSKAKSRTRRRPTGVSNRPLARCAIAANPVPSGPTVCSNCGWYHGRQAIEVS